MNKKYQVKSGSITINPKLIMSEIKYSWSINSGIGPLVLRLKVSGDNYSNDIPISMGSYIRVRCYDTNNDGTIVYYGHVYKIKSYITKGSEYVEYTVLGLSAHLSRFIYGASPDYIVSSSLSQGDTMKVIVPYSENITSSATPTYTGTFDKMTKLEAVKEVQKYAKGLYWTFSRSGVFTFLKYGQGGTHSFIMNKHITKLEIEDSVVNLCNRVIIVWAAGTYIKEDTVSISDHGKFEKVIEDTAIQSSYMATVRANKELEKGKKVLSVKLTINNNYNLESIEVGHRFKIYGIQNLSSTQYHVITSLNYSPTQVDITVGAIDNIVESLKSIDNK